MRTPYYQDEWVTLFHGDCEAIYLLNLVSRGIGGRSSLFRTTAKSVGSTIGISARAGGHPHAKPLDVLTELMSLPGITGIIADPFAGSGSTLVAAKRQNRKAIGVELDERWCEVAAGRLAQNYLDLAVPA